MSGLGQGRHRFDVAVVGAGPAGLSAAEPMAAAGVRVLVLEKAALPRYKPCGGGVVPRARALLPEDSAAVFHRLCRIARLHIHELGTFFEARRDPWLLAMTMRSELDGCLAQRVARAGVRVQSSCRLMRAEDRGGCVHLSTSRGDFRAEIVVAADGALSTAARLAGFGPPAGLFPAIEAEIQVDACLLERFASRARFDFGLLGQGYAWVFPKKDHLSLGVVSRGPWPQRPRELVDRYCRHLGVGQDAPKIIRGHVIPTVPRPAPFMRSRTILAGDAAGLADPLTFEGISHALLSGRLAARAIMEGELRPDRTAEVYAWLLNTQIVKDLKWGRWLAAVLYGNPRLRAFLFSRYGQEMVDALADLMEGRKTYRQIVRRLPGAWLSPSSDSSTKTPCFPA